MFRLPVFFAFAALLAVPVQCGKTLVTVLISLICKGPFTYTIYLYEVDYSLIFNPEFHFRLTDTTFNDLIATLGGEASDEFEGVLSGYDNGDWGKSYEFVV